MGFGEECGAGVGSCNGAAKADRALQPGFRERVEYGAEDFLGAALWQLPGCRQKLSKITDTKSPLMELFYFVSHNIDLASADVKAPFAPVQAVEPPGPADKPPDVLISRTTQDYMKALGGLQAAVHTIAQSPGAPDPSLGAQVSTAQSNASGAVTRVITSIPVDNSQPWGTRSKCGACWRDQSPESMGRTNPAA